jgi:hypothetical protein
MVVERDGSIRFRYPHIYYLSCSKALQLHRQDPARRDAAGAELERLYATLHNDASANILMFYLHFSRDLEAVQKVVGVAESLFADRPAADLLTLDLGGCVPWPSELLGELAADQGESIRRYRAAQDEADRARVGLASLKAEDERAFEHLNQYYRCIKVVHLIGQVIRSFPGMFPRELKIRSARAVVSVSLRAISDFAETLRGSRTALRAAIVEYLATTRRLENAEDAKSRADTAIFYMALAAGHGLIRRAVLSLGSSHILPTLEVLSGEDLGSGFRIIDMAIRLDLARDRASVRDAMAVRDAVSTSGFASLIVRQLVMDFLNTFRLPAGLRQKFMTTFELKGGQRLLPARGELGPPKN